MQEKFIIKSFKFTCIILSRRIGQPFLGFVTFKLFEFQMRHDLNVKQLFFLTVHEKDFKQL